MDSLTIFKEALLTRLLPLFNEVTLGAIRHLQPENYALGAVIAAAGALFASVLLYLFGVWLRRMPERVSTEEQQARVCGMQQSARKWLPWLLILAPTPIGGALIMAAGFFRLHPAVTAAAVIGAELLWRISPYIR